MRMRTSLNFIERDHLKLPGRRTFHNLTEETFYLLQTKQIVKYKNAFNIFFEDDNVLVRYMLAKAYLRDLRRIRNKVEDYYQTKHELNITGEFFRYPLYYKEPWAWIGAVFDDRFGRFELINPGVVASYDFSHIFRVIILGDNLIQSLMQLCYEFLYLIKIPFLFIFMNMKLKILDIQDFVMDGWLMKDIGALSLVLMLWFICLIILFLGLHLLVFFTLSLSWYLTYLIYFNVSILIGAYSLKKQRYIEVNFSMISLWTYEFDKYIMPSHNISIKGIFQRLLGASAYHRIISQRYLMVKEFKQYRNLPYINKFSTPWHEPNLVKDAHISNSSNIINEILHYL